ncbi:aKG-HExxH-type peptide beta-hydroxylase [Streptomyces sp. NPDC059850]|uniref:aKG-HExxH-type peptide beta-hydroxylase n=1 Tax=Streptomyces sp. NPDC059850 TaxID=3346970 RepID=UPI003650D38A
MSESTAFGSTALDVASRADTILCVDRQFGDSAAIYQRNMARFRVGLTMLARQDDICADVLRSTAAAPEGRLHPLLFDPVLRNCFEVDIARLENGSLERSSLARYVPSPPVNDSPTGPCEALTHPHRRAWPGLGDAWVLTEPKPHGGPEELLAERLMELYRGALGASGAPRPVHPTDDLCAALRDGAELLATLMPAAGAGVLRHITMVGFTHRESREGPLQSMSGGDPLPSSVLLAPERCASPWLVAESLLHEGAHLKLFDALRTGSVATNATERVPIPWRIGSWTVIRVLVALHFYVHLLVFQTAAAAAGEAVRERFGPPPPAEVIDEPTPGTPAAQHGTYRTSAERARYLAECALSLPERALTEHGRRFVRWLLTAFRLVDPEAPAQPPTPPRPAPPHPAGFPPGAAPRRVTPVDACALPTLGQLVVSPADTARMHWLNSRSWTVYSLCDGRDLTALHTSYVRAAGLPADSPEATRHVSEGIHHLLAAGLITLDA